MHSVCGKDSRCCGKQDDDSVKEGRGLKDAHQSACGNSALPYVSGLRSPFARPRRPAIDELALPSVVFQFLLRSRRQSQAIRVPVSLWCLLSVLVPVLEHAKNATHTSDASLQSAAHMPPILTACACFFPAPVDYKACTVVEHLQNRRLVCTDT